MSSSTITLITGANKGIGLETARQLAEQGHMVLLGARDQGKGQSAAERLQAEGLTVRAVKLEVTSPADRAAVAEMIANEYGHLDVLVNNAGVLLDSGHKASGVSVDVIRETFETNFFSLVALTQLLLPLIRKSVAGRIVNLSSTLGSLTTNATQNLGPYAMVGYNSSKAAVNMFTVILAKELAGTPIKVNAVHPGWVKTDMGTAAAPMDVPDGAKTSVRMATLGADGPTGTFVHMDEKLPW